MIIAGDVTRPEVGDTCKLQRTRAQRRESASCRFGCLSDNLRVQADEALRQWLVPPMMRDYIH